MEYFWGRVARPIRPSSRGRSRASRRIRPPQGATSEARNLTGYPRRARSPPPRNLEINASDCVRSTNSYSGIVWRWLLIPAFVANWLHRWLRSSGSGNIVMPVIEPVPSSSRRGSFLRTAKRANHLKWLLAGIMAPGALIGAGSVYKDRCEPSVPTEIFEGITYGCKRLDTTEEGNGLVHWMSINLATPGIELYVTPLDPAAVAQGWQYRLRRVGDVVDVVKEKLAVAVNGTKDGKLLDGGGSSSMAIGKDAAGVSAGVLYGGWRPVATHFGERARPIRMGK